MTVRANDGLPDEISLPHYCADAYHVHKMNVNCGPCWADQIYSQI
jgi:hypothetical protein